MDRDRLVASIKRHEGYRKEPYRDTNGYWTIGYGHLIEELDLDYNDANLGALLNRISAKSVHDNWLLKDVEEAIQRAKRYLHAFETLSDLRQEVLVEMAFQLGNNLFQFRRLREAIDRKAWKAARTEMLDSKWAREDSPKRAKKLADMFLNG